MDRNGLKWFEKKWFVNLAVKKRLTISFLFLAVIAAAIGIAGILFSLSANVPNAGIFAGVIGHGILI